MKKIQIQYPINEYPFRGAQKVTDLGDYAIDHIPTRRYGIVRREPGAVYPYYTEVQVTASGNIYSVPGF